jgi:hypothetical protein
MLKPRCACLRSSHHMQVGIDGVWTIDVGLNVDNRWSGSGSRLT